jgi:hypothetical protein
MFSTVGSFQYFVVQNVKKNFPDLDPTTVKVNSIAKSDNDIEFGVTATSNNTTKYGRGIYF